MSDEWSTLKLVERQMIVHALRVVRDVFAEDKVMILKEQKSQEWDKDAVKRMADHFDGMVKQCDDLVDRLE